jgi:tetratricopeptide (TPR) repeat protein
MLCHRTVIVVATLLFVIQAAGQTQTPRTAVNRYQDGNRKLRQGDLDGAIEDLTRSIEISSRLEPPKNSRRPVPANGFTHSDSEASGITVVDLFTAEVYTSRCLARYLKGEFEVAIADCNRAIDIRPALAAAYLNRGSARYGKGDRQGALADWNRTLEIDPHLAGAYCNRGALRQVSGDLAGAFSDLDEAIRLAPREAKSYCNRGFAWLDKQNYDRALSDFDKAIELNPQMAWAYEGRGIAHLNKSQFESAITDFGLAVQFEPQLAEAYVNRGLTLLLQNKDSEALPDFEHALALAPNLKEEIERQSKAVGKLKASQRKDYQVRKMRDIDRRFRRPTKSLERKRNNTNNYELLTS